LGELRAFTAENTENAEKDVSTSLNVFLCVLRVLYGEKLLIFRKRKSGVPQYPEHAASLVLRNY